MVSNRFAAGLGIRTAVLFGWLAALAYLATATELRATLLVVAVITVAQAIAIVRFIDRTHRELARFVDAVRYDDVAQSFSPRQLGTGFDALQRALDDALQRFRARRLADAAERHHLETVVQHVPVAILTVQEDESVQLLNNAARRLLDAPARTTLAALARHGHAFRRDLAHARAGDRVLTRSELGGTTRHLVLSATAITIGTRTERLVSLQDIQSEIDSTELAAWQDMMRVLTHELMNSLTPIASLARTAAEVVGELEASEPAREEELHRDLSAAVETIARRSEGLMRFAKSYRQLATLPPPVLRPIAVDGYLRRLRQLIEAEWSDRGIVLHVREPPPALVLMADEGLLDQALLNLLRNAADAAEARETPEVYVHASISERGRAVIEIADNGPGLDDGTRDAIFLPFFTTKPDGSGIGLALARQVMLVHEGSITAQTRPGGGAIFRLTF